MGRRKRKQQSYKRMKRVPKIFNCPSCGEKSVKVEKTNNSTEVPQEDGSIREVSLATALWFSKRSYLIFYWRTC